MRAQQRMNAVRHPALADGEDERGLLLQRRQHLAGVGPTGHRGREPGRELVADADGAEQVTVSAGRRERISPTR